MAEATPKQLKYMVTLARRGNLHTNSLPFDEILKLLSEKYEFNFDTITHEDAVRVIPLLKKKAAWVYKKHGLSWN